MQCGVVYWLCRRVTGVPGGDCRRAGLGRSTSADYARLGGQHYSRPRHARVARATRAQSERPGRAPAERPGRAPAGGGDQPDWACHRWV